MSIVYRARDLRLDRGVAVKTVFLYQKGTSELSALQREAKLAASLEHAYIVHIYGFMADAEPPCFVMELVEGTPLPLYAKWVST
jgi:serine/threonine protein kinase